MRGRAVVARLPDALAPEFAGLSGLPRKEGSMNANVSTVSMAPTAPGSEGVEEHKKLPPCSWPSIRNSERVYQLSRTWARWWGLDVTNFVRTGVCFLIVASKVYAMFQEDRVNWFYKIDRALPLDQ
ncbi:MAG: hypothetical protein AB7T38_02660 [Nitrospirales bacterium]